MSNESLPSPITPIRPASTVRATPNDCLNCGSPASHHLNVEDVLMCCSVPGHTTGYFYRAPASAPLDAPTARYECVHCGRDFLTERGLGSHYAAWPDCLRVLYDEQDRAAGAPTPPTPPEAITASLREKAARVPDMPLAEALKLADMTGLFDEDESAAPPTPSGIGEDLAMLRRHVDYVCEGKTGAPLSQALARIESAVSRVVKERDELGRSVDIKNRQLSTIGRTVGQETEEHVVDAVARHVATVATLQAKADAATERHWAEVESLRARVAALTETLTHVQLDVDRYFAPRAGITGPSIYTLHKEAVGALSTIRDRLAALSPSGGPT